MSQIQCRRSIYFSGQNFLEWFHPLTLFTMCLAKREGIAQAGKGKKKIFFTVCVWMYENKYNVVIFVSLNIWHVWNNIREYQQFYNIKVRITSKSLSFPFSFHPIWDDNKNPCSMENVSSHLSLISFLSCQLNDWNVVQSIHSSSFLSLLFHPIQICVKDLSVYLICWTLQSLVKIMST